MPKRSWIACGSIRENSIATHCEDKHPTKEIAQLILYSAANPSEVVLCVKNIKQM